MIYYFHNETIPLLLIDLYAKNEKENLSRAERNAFIFTGLRYFRRRINFFIRSQIRLTAGRS